MKNRIDKIIKWKAQPRDAFGLSIFAAAIVSAVFLASENVGEVRVTNFTNQVLPKCDVTVCGSQHSLNELSPGESRQFFFFITGDSGYTVRYRDRDSGEEKVSEEAGYTCCGLGSFGKPALIRIYNNRIEFSDGAVDKVDVLSISKAP